MRKGYKEMTYTKRIELETLLKAGYSVIEAARMLNVCEKTVYNELHRGKYTHTKSDLTTQTRYSAQIAQEKRDYNVSARGTIPKVLKDKKLAKAIEEKIVDKGYSPEYFIEKIIYIGYYYIIMRRKGFALTKGKYMFEYTNKTRDNIQNMILFFTDSLCMLLAYYISGVLWLIAYRKYSAHDTLSMLRGSFVTVLFAVIITALFVNVSSDFVIRGKFEELKSVLQKSLVFAACVAVYELIRKTSEIPRGVYIFTILVGGILMYLTRYIVKWYLVARNKSKMHASRVILVTMKDRAQLDVKLINKDEDWIRTVAGIVIVDDNMVGEEFEGINVVANTHTMMRYIKNEVVDEVFIDLDYKLREQIRPMVMELEDMGIMVHLRVEVLDSFKDFDTSLGHLGKIPVITFANRIFDYKELLVKRCIDIFGGIIGIVIMFIAMIFVAPALKLESKGPLFFKQKRVGKNGRYFYIYKFRSMYVDAEDRLKDLMEQNEMSGLMFKMTDDPRITKVGKFIRKTSIDELPQFINVLKGDMSLVGTRPPTVNEFKQYEGHHKRRLSMKPGLTGMWQAYGRNTVQDFEDVVKMDLEYIDNWSIGLDFKIIFKTILTVFTVGGK